MKKLMIATGLLMVTGASMAAETWKEGNTAPVNVTFTAPDTVRFSRETHYSFNKATPLLASTVLGAVTASKAGGDGAGIRFKWVYPYTASGKGDVTDFKNGNGASIAVKLKDTQGSPLLLAEADAGTYWYQVEGAASDSDVTVQFYPENDIKTDVPAGHYTAGIQAAVYSN